MGEGATVSERIQELLDEVIHSRHHEWWLREPNRMFSGQSPQQVIDAGRADEVEAYLTALAEGVVM